MKILSNNIYFYNNYGRKVLIELIFYGISYNCISKNHTKIWYNMNNIHFYNKYYIAIEIMIFTKFGQKIKVIRFIAYCVWF